MVQRGRGGFKSEIRRLEIRKKSEGRNPKPSVMLNFVQFCYFRYFFKISFPLRACVYSPTFNLSSCA